MKYLFGLAAIGLFTLGACTGSEPEPSATAPEPEAIISPSGDAETDTMTARTDEDCTPPNCDTGGGTRPVEEVATAPQN